MANEDWTTYSSESRIYTLSKSITSDYQKLGEFADFFIKGFENERENMIKRDFPSAISLGIYHNEKFLDGIMPRNFFSELDYLANSKYSDERLIISLNVERLGWGYNNELLGGSSFNLAEISKPKDSPLKLKIKGHHTIAINPNFLYEVGETFGKRFE